MQGRIGAAALTTQPVFAALPDQPPGVDLFEDLGASNLYPAFVYPRDGVTQRA